MALIWPSGCAVYSSIIALYNLNSHYSVTGLNLKLRSPDFEVYLFYSLFFFLLWSYEEEREGGGWRWNDSISNCQQQRDHCHVVWQ